MFLQWTFIFVNAKTVTTSFILKKSNAMKKSVLMFLSFALVLAGCSVNNSKSATTSSSQEPIDPSLKETTVKVESCYSGETQKYYDIKVAYKDSLFQGASDTFNKDLAMLSYGFSIVSEEKDEAKQFFKDLAFTNAEYASEYDDKPKVDGVGYCFATKIVNGYNIVGVSIRGFNYRVQWVDNFNVGTEGDHLGFSESADTVIEALNTYVGKIKNNKPIKLWLTGYSRGGAIANVMSSKFLSDETSKFKKDNLYTYTFEAPRGLTLEHAVAYENVFNIINSGDIFTRVCPEEYGLYRCGKDIDIYSKDIDNLIEAFDKDAVIPAFKSNILYKDDTQWAKYFVQCLLAGDDPDEGERNWSASTRELYNLNYGEDIRIIILTINATEDVTLMDLISRLQELSASDIATLLLGSVAGFVLLIKEILTDLKVGYDDGQITKALTELYNYISKPTVAIAIAALCTKDTGRRMVAMHKPDTTYILLNAYEA